MPAKKASSAGKRNSPAKKVATKEIVSKTAAAAKADEKVVERKMPTPAALIGEFLGTFVLAGAFITMFNGGVQGHIGIALVLIALVVVFGVISRAHMNPAITIALWANRKFGGVKTILYIVAQVLGGVLAWLVLSAIFNASFEAAITTNLISQQGVTQDMIDQAGGLLKFAQANGFDTLNALAARIGVSTFVDVNLAKDALPTFFAELIGAIIFGLSAGYAFIKHHRRPIVKALALGFGLFAGLMIGGGLAILNPAVAGALGGFAAVNPFGSDAMTFWWPVVVYVVAPIAGVVIGVTTYRFLFKNSIDCKCDKYCDDKCHCECHKA